MNQEPTPAKGRLTDGFGRVPERADFEAPTQETDMTTLREAAQQALAALEDLSDCYDGDDDYDGECASCHTRSYLSHDADCKRNNAVNALRVALKREEEALAWLEERKQHWKRELDRMRSPQ